MLKRDTRRLGLADRLESILRTDRHAIRRQQSRGRGLLLALVSGEGGYRDLFNLLLKDASAEIGLSYLALETDQLIEIPPHLLDQTSLVVADVSGRNECVITLVYQAMGQSCRILLCSRDPDDIPPDLDGLEMVLVRAEEDGRELQRKALESTRLLTPVSLRG